MVGLLPVPMARIAELSRMKLVDTVVEAGAGEFRYSAVVKPAEYTVLEPAKHDRSGNAVARLVDETRAHIREESARQTAVLLVPGQPQREERAERARLLLIAAENTKRTGMRVPVYFTELAVAIRFCLYGKDDNLVQAMGRHNQHMARCGVKGVIESLQ